MWRKLHTVLSFCVVVFFLVSGYESRCGLQHFYDTSNKHHITVWQVHIPLFIFFSKDCNRLLSSKIKVTDIRDVLLRMFSFLPLPQIAIFLFVTYTRKFFPITTYITEGLCANKSESSDQLFKASFLFWTS